MRHPNSFDDRQISEILDRLVPQIAKPDDESFFRGLLRIKAEESSSANFTRFVGTMLKTAKGTP